MQVTALYRHPIKSHGREALDAVTLHAGQSMPFDRLWAVAHDAAKAQPGEWARCANFSRVSKAPQLMAITAKLDVETGLLTLRHPDRPDLTFDPDAQGEQLIDWVNALVPQNRALPSHIMRLDGRGYTDSDFPSVTLCNLASHRAVEMQLGHDLSIHRWRGNIWFDSNASWAEFDWMGRDVAIGDCVLRLRERTDRCVATTANPETGIRDAETLKALEAFGHQDFSVRCEVIQGGALRLGDVVMPL